MATGTFGLKELKVTDKDKIVTKSSQDYDAYLKNLGDFVGQFFNEAQYSDLDIWLEDGHQLSGHKLILASRSSYWGVSDLLHVQHLDLSDIKYDVAFCLMKWVYTNTIDLHKEDLSFLTELLRTSTKFKLDCLSEICEESIIPLIDIDNCDKYLHIAQNIGAGTLINYCWNFKPSTEDQNDLVLKCENDNEDDDDNDDENNGDDYKSDSDTEQTITTKSKRKKQTKDKLSCFYCNEKFKTSEDLQEHEDIHKGVPNPFECTICGLKGMGNRRRLLRHLEAHKPNNDKNKEKKCNVCGEVFNNTMNWKLHMKSKHPESKRYKCEYCQKPYKKRCDLEIHTRLHTGERPYTCEICGKAFRDVGTLRMHVRTHDPNKPFVCDICGSAFISIGALNSHAKHHNADYKKNKKKTCICNICGVAFAQSFYLKTHEKIHSGEKPHQCNNCGKTFTDRSSFRRHSKIHTGEKPHSCEVCGKSFIQRVQLVKHRVVHHKQTVSNPTQPQTYVERQSIDNLDFSEKNINFMDQLYQVI